MDTAEIPLKSRERRSRRAAKRLGLRVSRVTPKSTGGEGRWWVTNGQDAILTDGDTDLTLEYLEVYLEVLEKLDAKTGKRT